MLCILPHSPAPVVTKQTAAGLMTQTNRGSDPNKIIWTQSSGGQGEGGEQTNSGSDQASEPSVKAP